MSWLRIDDGFSRHPKVTALTHKQRWIWVDILCYCARYNTHGFLPENFQEHVPGATEKYIEKCLDLGLLDDMGDDGLKVHDWRIYAPKDPTGAERQAAWRRKKRNGSVTETVTDNVTAESSTSRVGTRARSRPVLSEVTQRAVKDRASTAPESVIDIRTLIDDTLKEAS
jgi:hypothetical protein